MELPPPLPTKDKPKEEEGGGGEEKEEDDLPPSAIVTHLIELFFQYVNSVFPLVHRGRLRQSIQDGTVSKPLLWALMAIAARFSDHPSIKTDPPYWAGEKFATKATQSINASLLEPTIPNLQFWGIMSCLEYGRASGSKAWTYGGIAVRICQELGLNKESVLRTPILSEGTVDYVAMALRRRIFWSCLCIDKFASTSTNRPQGFEVGDYDVQYPTRTESSLLLDPLQNFTVDRRVVTNDPLMDVVPHYVGVLERFGEICKYMSRAKTDGSQVTWPPIAEFSQLDTSMRVWKESLPDHFRFSAAMVAKYRETATQNYLNFWICAHAMYCTGMLALHRGSLAYSDLGPSELPSDVYKQIQASVACCKEQVETATEVFRCLRDTCGCNVLPYMGYCAYIFSTVLMTSVFSSDPVAYTKSSLGLAILFDTIKILGPYWPMSERLALTTRDMLSTHSRLYEIEANHRMPIPLKITQSPESMASISTTDTPSIPANHVNYMAMPYTTQPTDIDFNSCEFLNDSALFGQMIFDSSKLQYMMYNTPPHLFNKQ
ncbi:fungal-specific transcription factor domain-containing protein [Gilbertella persicaria]|uniref:fungal-specific transcription factor domain-containing protein n=1 Tax=Gilbertella persicaria TaxID=101096 RepID=UPI00221F4F74|nr:fungal-specific transcription factor domain-containing protein [Gilbertella persicaria]KAI8063387.1 fungal-specific transcription factor domain-containing protein [Gilbertella persicaria]